MTLLNLDENEKQHRIEELKQERKLILGATRTDALRQEVSFLQSILNLMLSKTSGEVKETVERTREEIEGFWMHDKTRADVARWVQTLICVLGQE